MTDQPPHTGPFITGGDTPPPLPSDPSGSRDQRARRPRRTFTWIMVIAVLSILGAAGATALSVRTAVNTVTVPRVQVAPEPACPRPADGSDSLDAAGSDCTTPLDADGVFDQSDELVSVQGHEYRPLTNDATRACASVIDTVPSAALVGCSSVIRGLYATKDGAALGAGALVTFDTAAQADALHRAMKNGRSFVTAPTAPGTPRLETLDGLIGACPSPLGRYVLCVSAAPTASASAAAGSSSQLSELARDISFLMVDSIVARRFASQ